MALVDDIKAYCEANGKNPTFEQDVVLQDNSDGQGAFVRRWPYQDLAINPLWPYFPNGKNPLTDPEPTP